MSRAAAPRALSAGRVVRPVIDETVPGVAAQSTAQVETIAISGDEVEAKARGGTKAKARRRVKGARWSGAAEKAFLKELAESCNVKRAAAAAGFTTEACYKQRARRPDFAAAWALARAQGYERLEDILIARALAGWRGSGGAPGGGTGAAGGAGRGMDSPLSTAVIHFLLRAHRGVRDGSGTFYRSWG